MIQRKQTLFLLEIAFLSISLLFIPVQFIIINADQTPLCLLPIKHELLSSTLGHFAAIGINFLAIIISFVSIFLYKKRALQIKLCYTLAALYIILLAMVALCPFVESGESSFQIKYSIFGIVILAVSTISAFIAARLIKKDVELLRSADRIR